MTEIKLDVKDPRLAASQLRHAANHWNDGPPKSNPVGDLLLSLADSIEEQVNPAIEEPTEFGSLIRANTGGGRQLLQRPGQARGKHYWENEDGGSWLWPELTEVEVLRVGVGDEAAYNNGVSDTVSALVARLLEKRHGTNLMQKRDAFTEA
ncbi:hypothetical protein, partial [Streptomyces sp.]|uniref:hypothetical protein n=1 Tax=Streptomyces sp. TaxID=1931 RepID=UPI002F926DCE